MKNIVFGVVLIALGFAAGFLLSGGDGAPPQDDSEAAAESTLAEDLRNLAAQYDETLGLVEGLKEKNATLESDLARALENIEQLKSESEVLAVAAKGNEKSLDIAFGEYADLDALLKADWPELAAAAKALQPYLEELAAMLARGESPDREFFMKLGKHNMKLIGLAVSLNDKVPTHDKNANGAFTHPLATANLVSELLASKDNPLSDNQRVELAKLGEAYEKEWKLREAGYDEGELRLTKYLEEIELKMEFRNGLESMLGDDQRQAVFSEKVRGQSGIDLFSPSLMFSGSGMPLALNSFDELRPALVKQTAEYLGLTAADLERNGHIFDRWVEDTRPLMATPVGRFSTQMGMYEEQAGFSAAWAQQRAMQEIIRSYDLSDEVIAKLTDEIMFVVPRLVEPPPVVEPEQPGE